jgi:hypothetical protein
MKRRPYSIIIAILAIVVSACIYLYFLKANAPKPHPQSESPIDLRPLIISKLQQLVKEISEGLYNLSIEKLEPDVLQSQIDVFNATLVPDTAALQRLDKELKAPDDVFKISFSSVHITGLSVLDFLHKDKINLDTIFITAPIVEVFHKRRVYNEAKRQRDSAFTFYQRLTQQFRSISINAIVAQQGTFITKNLSQKNKTRKFNQVKIIISKLLIDSSTQYDKKRFLFSREVELSTKDYVSRTPDSLYFFKVASISVLATKHTMKAKRVTLEPRGNRHEFQKKLSTRNDMFTVKFPEVVCNNIDWWALANGEGFYSEDTHAYNGFVGDYFNRALPPPRKPRKDNFPQQILRRVSQKISIKKLHVHKLKLSYEEYNPQSMQSGKVHFNNINATLNNVTNMPDSIKANKLFTCSGSGFFMHQIPVTARFKFDLSKARTGDFSADLHVGAMDKTIVNPIAEPLGMFTLKSGTIQQATAHIRGDNFKAKAKMVMLYNDLHVTPLKNPDSTGNLKKKTLAGFVANTFFIKDANPSLGESPRNPEVIAQREGGGTFFNFLWKAIFTASAKTIGIPSKFAE